MDGVRVDLPDGWILIRASNTSPVIRLTTEADNEAILQDLTTQFLARTHEIIEHMKATTQ
jgi:phosphomannomutase